MTFGHQVQTTAAHGWRSCASEEEVQSIKVEDRQPVGFHPEVSVLAAAETRYHWFMHILKNRNKGGPLGVVEDLVTNKEYQKKGAVHWHMLVWVRKVQFPSMQ